MPNALLKIVLLLVLGSATLSLHAAEHQFPQADLSKLGNIPTIDTPFYIMEYHIWHKSPFGQESPDGYVHWDMGHDRIDHLTHRLRLQINAMVWTLWHAHPRIK